MSVDYTKHTAADLHTITVNPNDDIYKNVKLPEFCESDTRRWFATVEQMLAGASETVKRNSLFRKVPITAMKDAGADATASFADIRNQLIQHFDRSAQQKMRELLQEQQLGSQKPSTAMRRLRELAPDNEGLVRYRFLEIMPDTVRLVLRSMTEDSLDKIAQIADLMLDGASNGTCQLGACAFSVQQQAAANASQVQGATAQPQTDKVSELAQKVDELTKAVQAIAANSGTHNNFRGRSRNRSRSRGGGQRFRSPSFGRNQNGGRGGTFRLLRGGSSRGRGQGGSRGGGFHPNGNLCYYHYYYGENAVKCQPPCTWDQQTQGNGMTPDQ